MIYARLGDSAAAKMYLYRAITLSPQFHVLHAEVAKATLASLEAGPGADDKNSAHLDQQGRVSGGLR